MPLFLDEASGVFDLPELPDDLAALFAAVAEALGIVGADGIELGFQILPGNPARLLIPGGWAWTDETVEPAITAHFAA